MPKRVSPGVVGEYFERAIFSAARVKGKHPPARPPDDEILNMNARRQQQFRKKRTGIYNAIRKGREGASSPCERKQGSKRGGCKPINSRYIYIYIYICYYTCMVPLLSFSRNFPLISSPLMFIWSSGARLSRPSLQACTNRFIYSFRKYPTLFRSGYNVQCYTRRIFRKEEAYTTLLVGCIGIQRYSA